MDWSEAAYYSLAGLLAITSLPTITFILIQYRRSHRVPSDLPWAGLQDKWLFPKTRAMMREWSVGRKPLIEGYEKYSKQGKAFVLPATHWPDVALPPSLNGWLIAQPDTVLSTRRTQDDLLSLDQMSHGPDLAAVHDFSIITRDLTRQMGRLLPDLMDEFTASFDEAFGQDEEEWKEVRLYDAVEKASRKAANRAFLGLALCRDKRVMDRIISASLLFSLCGICLRMLVPSSLRDLLGPVVCLPFFYERWRLTRLLRPHIDERMALTREVHRDEGSGKAESPNDALQWITASSYDPANDTFALSPSDIAAKCILLNSFAVFTTAISAGTVLYDILTYNPTSTSQAQPSNTDLLDQLRDEAAFILPQLRTDPTAVRQMTKLDSAIRETLRFNPMMGRGIQREVVQPGGVTTPDGLFLPQGTHVCAIISAMQRDADLQKEDAGQYRPLRFYKSDPDEKHVGAVQISESFLSFSLGKHACPGRFFAVQVMKVMIGWVLLHYDFEVVLLEGKTEVEWLEVGEARMPPQGNKGMVKVRRRKAEESYLDLQLEAEQQG